MMFPSLILDKVASDMIDLHDQTLFSYRAYWNQQKARIAETLSILLEKNDQYDHDLQILDMGCNPPFLLACLTQMGLDCQGVDIFPESFASITRDFNLDVIKCDIENEALPLSNNTYDVLLLTEVFEHLRVNPVRTFEEIFRVIRPGGYLLLSTPNLHSLNGIYNFLFHGKAYACASDSVYKQFNIINRLGWFGHMREYTWQEVESFLMETGFVTIETRFFGGASQKPFLQPVYSAFPRLRPIVHFVAYKPIISSDV